MGQIRAVNSKLAKEAKSLLSNFLIYKLCLSYCTWLVGKGNRAHLKEPKCEVENPRNIFTKSKAFDLPVKVHNCEMAFRLFNMTIL